MRAECVISLPRLAVDYGVDQDVGADLVEVPHVAGRVLEVPVHLAGVGILGDRAVGEEVVARPVGRIVFRHRIADAPDRLVGRRDRRCRSPRARRRRSARRSVLSFQVSLPGSPGAGMVNLRQTSLPVAASSAAIQSRSPVEPPAAPMMILSLIASGAAAQAHAGRVEHDVRLPHDLAGVLVGGDDARRPVGDRDHEIAPQGDAAIGDLALLLRDPCARRCGPWSPELTSIL